MAKIDIGNGIEIDESELDESFVRASGPGGQNVNKVSSAVQLRFEVARSPSLTDDVRARLAKVCVRLRFDVARSPSLRDDVRARLVKLAGRRMTKDGELIIVANQYRTQERNRDDARTRLIELIARAAEPPPPPRR